MPCFQCFQCFGCMVFKKNICVCNLTCSLSRGSIPLCRSLELNKYDDDDDDDDDVYQLKGPALFCVTYR